MLLTDQMSTIPYSPIRFA